MGPAMDAMAEPVGMRGVAGLFANGGLGQAVGQRVQPMHMGRGMDLAPLGAGGAAPRGGGFGANGGAPGGFGGGAGGALPAVSNKHPGAAGARMMGADFMAGGARGALPSLPSFGEPQAGRKQKQFDAFGRRRY